MSTCRRNKAVDPRILIVGAGPAGIAAASKLFENGFKNVTILEAENRIGGRINTTKLGDYNVDLGGQWVHGEKGNVAYDLAYPLGLLHKINTSQTSLAQKYFDSLGNPIKDDIAENISNFYDNYVDDPALDDNAPCDSIGEYAEKMFDVQFKDSQDIYDQKQKYLRYLELVKIGMESTESWYNLPITGGDDYANYPGDSIINWKDRGFSTILDILMKKIPDPKKELPVSANTYLNSEVVSINYSKNNREKSILITTTDGRIYNADHVIVTIPLGVLKEKHKSMFVPPLPDNKVKTIEGLGYGNVAKVYLLFEKPFWKLHGERILQFTLMWNDAEKKEIEADSEKSWVLGVTSIQSIEHKPNLLMLWITGKYARAMEALPEDKVFNHAGELLHRFLNKTFNVTQPIGMVRTQWYTNTHFKGTYSYYSIEAKKHEVDAETLAEPVYPENLNLLFAGEATSKQRYGTADGAIVSGFRAAEEVLKHYKNIEK